MQGMPRKVAQYLPIEQAIQHLKAAESAMAVPGPGDNLADTAYIPDEKDRMPLRCFMRAAASYEWVCSHRPDLIPPPPKKYSHAQWEFIKEHGCPAYEDADGREISVPSFETWRREVRAGFYDPSNPKTSPRAGRKHGSSIVRSDQI